MTLGELLHRLEKISEEYGDGGEVMCQIQGTEFKWVMQAMRDDHDGKILLFHS